MNLDNRSHPKPVQIGAFLLCFLAAGIPFWRIPYSEVSVPNAFYGVGVIVVFVAAAVLAYRFGVIEGLRWSGLVLPAVLMARVVVEGVLDPTRHNLWPLALVIALVLGVAVAGAGAALGWLASRLRRRD